MSETTSGTGAAVDPARVAELLNDVILHVDDGALKATSQERAYLTGAASAMRHMTVSD